MRYIWVLTIDGHDGVTTALHASQSSAFTELRDKFSVDDETSDDDLLQDIIDTHGVSLYLEQHVIPDHLRIRIGHERLEPYGPVDWLRVIHEVNGVEKLFGQPEIVPSTPTSDYTEVYPEVDVILHDEGRGDATFVAKTEHAAQLIRDAVAELELTPGASQ